MTKHVSLILAGTALAILSACGGAGEKSPITPPPPPPQEMDTPLAPTINSGQIADGLADRDRINTFRDTPRLVALPRGTASYEGAIITDLNIDGDNSVNRLVGDLNMTVDLNFVGDDVDGSVTNLHTANGLTPVERLDGSLSVSGTLDDGTKQLNADLEGTLTGVIGDGEAGDLVVDGTLAGRTQDRFLRTNLIGINVYDEADGIFGTARGTITGSESGTFSGTFHAER